MNDQYFTPLFIAGFLLLTLFGLILIVYWLIQKKRQNEHLLEKRQMKFDYESNVLKMKIEQHEHTMDEISKELHDNVKSVLCLTQFNMYRMADIATTNDQVQLIEKTNKIVGQVIDDLHNISRLLDSNSVENEGLTETITKQLEHIRLAKNIEFDLVVKGEPVSLGEEKELHILRVAHEAIQNCARHAKASHLSFTLTYEPGTFTMEIADNGIGFDKNKIHEMRGVGFINMFQRTKYIHGLLDVQTVPSEGSKITLTLNTDSASQHFV